LALPLLPTLRRAGNGVPVPLTVRIHRKCAYSRQEGRPRSAVLGPAGMGPPGV